MHVCVCGLGVVCRTLTYILFFLFFFFNTREDLAISAPFYGGSGEAQRGAVVIVNSADNGQVSDQVEEIEQAATVILKGPVPYGRFGVEQKTN